MGVAQTTFLSDLIASTPLGTVQPGQTAAR